MKYFSFITFFLILSCGNKEDILLPKSNVTIVRTIDDISPVYVFFRTKGKDTLAEVNRKNTISTTNWVFNIDKRLPLRIAIPEIMKLQAKRRADSAHKNDDAQNYYSYADSIGKNLAFIPFTKVFYKLEKPAHYSNAIFFDSKNTIKVNDIRIKREDLQNYLNSIFVEKPIKMILCFDKKGSYERYIQNIIFIRGLILTNKTIGIDDSQELIY